MAYIWQCINTLFSIQFTIMGINMTFWQMAIGFFLMSLIVGFVSSLFD
jgi:hypothetical protein